jgi:anaerobic carbon-monoxide dehydrogenase iron sulfur subunit
MDVLQIDTKLCNGCRICELACSFHHTGLFAPEKSSIEALNDYLNGEIKIIVSSACDLCEKEDEPLCVKYCFTGALKGENKHHEK